MSSNPFDDENGDFLVLVNADGQYSLWPTFKEVPAGWTVERDAGTRAASLDYISEKWSDMRPQASRRTAE
jgi:MbtH protein